MKITNNHNLPPFLVAALSVDKYTKGDADISVTQLIDSPRVKVLQEDMANEMESDISEKVWSVFGTAAHGVMEDAVNATESSDSVRISEERLNVQVDDWKVSGAIDLQEIHDSDGTVSISDFKVTSVWSVIFGKKSWEQQLNAYAWRVRNAKDQEVRDLSIVAILRDWQRRKAQQEDSYPSCPIAVVPITLWDKETQDAYMAERISIHQKAIYEQLTNGTLPHCSDEDRWKQADKFAVMKKGRVRAIKLHNDLDDAEEHAHNMGSDHFVETRKGKNTRCVDDWCGVSQWCDQYQSEVMGKEEGN